MLNSLHLVQITMCVILLVVANGAPVVIADLFKSHWNRPIDGGHLFLDGRPWLGRSKTWRGILSAMLATCLVAILLGFDWQLGMLFASLAMLGDLFASFCKRRMGLAVSARAWFLDQIPESFLPALFIREAIGLSLVDVFIAVAIFTLLDLVLSPLLYRLNIRQRPY
jgi:CDP-2,3-bis-(O-geranylgeranyl)-sn-glycerol synthase